MKDEIKKYYQKWLEQVDENITVEFPEWLDANYKEPDNKLTRERVLEILNEKCFASMPILGKSVVYGCKEAAEQICKLIPDKKEELHKAFEAGKKYWSDVQTDEPLLFKPIDFEEWYQSLIK